MRRESMLCRPWLLCSVFLLGHGGAAPAQTISHRGIVEGTALAFPQESPQDRTRLVGDLLAREEVTLKPARWLLFAAGMDFRANSHDQVEERWQVDISDRTARRPRISIRRLAATLTRGRFTVDIGKQFIRWGKTDIVVPTDRFAPRDFLNVVDATYLAVVAVRGTAQIGSHTIDAVWAPRFTPSRIPLPGQRWAELPAGLGPATALVEAPTAFPEGAQTGIRWGQVAGAAEYSFSVYNGFNHLPDIRTGAFDPVLNQIEYSRVYPPIRTYGFDFAFPVRWFTVKAEAAYFSSPTRIADEYVLYVLQVERQSGEWVFVGGYAGEAVTRQRSLLSFDPDRGLSRSVVVRAAYAINANRRVEFEGAARQNGDGVYAKAEYSQARGQHWRATVAAVVFGGDRDDFMGQYRRNSHVRLTVRYSF